MSRPPPPQAPTAPTAPTAPAIARQAVHWLLALQDGHAPGRQQALHAQWQAWLAADPAHAQAWQRIADMDARLRALPAPVALRTLAAPALGRRRAVQLALLCTAGGAGWLAAHETPIGRQWAAGLRTRTGERREAVLADGTRLQLNTATAVDVRYTAAERLLVLHAGDLLVATAPDAAARPLGVRTGQGLVRALGTRFTVSERAARSDVAVLEGAVELRPAEAASAAPQRLGAGERGHLTRAQAALDGPLRAADGAWSQGMLVADDLPLAGFIAELARHRPGVLRCAPEVAALRLSGSYPLGDTDRVLAALTRSLPVQIRVRTRWWVTVEALAS